MLNQLFATITALLLACTVATPALAIEKSPGSNSSASASRRYSLKDLAGQYSFGNGLDLNYELHISADGQFTYEQASYEGVAAQAAGTAFYQEEKLVLSPTSATPEAWPAGMGLELIPVSWGKRMYLVPEKDMVRFVNAVNGGSEPVEQVSRGSFFLREGDLDHSVTGRPQLPPTYASMLLDKPVRGKVLAREQDGKWKLDVGRKSGMHPGMELSAWSPDQQQCVTLIVATVQDDCCMAQIRQQNTSPLLNWKVCSRLQYE